MNVPLQGELLSSQSLVSLADKHLGRVLRHKPSFSYSPDRLSFIETNVGVTALILARGLWTSEEVIRNSCKSSHEYLIHVVQTALDEDARNDIYSPSNKEDGCEVLYGRAGLLYALLYLRKAFQGKDETSVHDLTSDKVLSSLVDSIMTRGKHGGFLLSSEFRTGDFAHLPPLMWTWHGKRYLGGAHGVAGILHILLCCPGSVIQKHLPDIFGTISWLMEIQDDDGNWPSKAPTQRGFSSPNDLIQWCHGAPGMIILLSTALRVLHEQEEKIVVEEGFTDKIRRSIESAANLVYKRGLLRKGVGLCHGVAGSVYALLAASSALDGSSSDRPYLAKAAHLGLLATLREEMTAKGEMSVPDHPWSLYEGLAGTCCAWAEILCRLDSSGSPRALSGFPAYDDLVGLV
ncbi:Lanthionine synthetase C-like protein [Agrocybe pediades]|nr:Lanthionine synthetase C-like protein [Agrocybe pediades]